MPQAEFARTQEVILEKLETRIRADNEARAKRYRLLKLVLFGSFAKGTWFEDSRSGRASDVDRLAIVSHKALTGMSAFWREVEDRLFTDPLIKRDVSIIVHTVQDVNRQLRDGQYFLSEFIQQSILLYEDTEPDKNGNLKHLLAKPAAPHSQKVYDQATEYARYCKRAAEQLLIIGRQGIVTGSGWERNTAFQLHQAADDPAP